MRLFVRHEGAIGGSDIFEMFKIVEVKRVEFEEESPISSQILLFVEKDELGRML